MKKTFLVFLIFISFSTFAKEVCILNSDFEDEFFSSCTLKSDSISADKKKSALKIIKILTDKGYEVKAGDLSYGIVMIKQ